MFGTKRTIILEDFKRECFVYNTLYFCQTGKNGGKSHFFRVKGKSLMTNQQQPVAVKSRV